MKKLVLTIVFVLSFLNLKAQSCDDLIKYVKSQSTGTSYDSPLSTAISKVTFYNIVIDYETHYFAIVCFKSSEYSLGCNEYIYAVGNTTETSYSMNYINSAGKAFWKYIQPFNGVLNCGVSFD